MFLILPLVDFSCIISKWSSDNVQGNRSCSGDGLGSCGVRTVRFLLILPSFLQQYGTLSVDLLHLQELDRFMASYLVQTVMWVYSWYAGIVSIWWLLVTSMHTPKVCRCSTYHMFCSSDLLYVKFPHPIAIANQFIVTHLCTVFKQGSQNIWDQLPTTYFLLTVFSFVLLKPVCLLSL